MTFLQKESGIPTTDSDELSFQFDTEIKGGSMIALNGDDASGSTPKRDTGRGKSRLTVLVYSMYYAYSLSSGKTLFFVSNKKMKYVVYSNQDEEMADEAIGNLIIMTPSKRTLDRTGIHQVCTITHFSCYTFIPVHV